MPWIMPIGNERGLRCADTRHSYRWTVRQHRSRQREAIASRVVPGSGMGTV